MRPRHACKAQSVPFSPTIEIGNVLVALTRGASMRDGDYSRRVIGPMMRVFIARLPMRRGTFSLDVAADGAVDAGVPVGIVRTERYGGWSPRRPTQHQAARICQRYFAALMNWLNASHHTTAVV